MTRPPADLSPAFSPEELSGLLTSVGGSHARRLTPVEVGQLLRREVDRGVTAGRLAEELHMPAGTSVIAWFLRLPDLPEEVQGLVQFGRPAAGLSLTQAAEIARLRPESEAMHRLAATTIEHRLTGAETRSAVQLMKRRGISVDDAIAEVLRGRPTVERRHVMIGTLSPPVVDLLSGHDAASREILLRDVLDHLNVKAEHARLTARRYTLVLEDAEANRLRRQGLGPDELETALNESLAAQVR